MPEGISKTSEKSGLPPGTLIHIGKVKTEKVNITAINYNVDDFNQFEYSLEECLQFKDSNKFYWINIDGLQNTEVIDKVGKQLNLHPLLLEDILNTNQRPKVEEFDNYLFLSLKMLGISKRGDKIISEQVSFVLGNNWLLSFQEQQGDVFDVIRTRLRENKGVIRKKGIDYLFYSLIDAIVDNYFFVTEHFSDKIEILEEQILHNPSQESLQKIQKLKRLLMNFRKSIIPLREAVASLQKYNVELIKESTFRYLRDVYEHLIHLSDSLESHRDMLASIMDLYLSGVSNKMNEVMKVLTIIATIFIPLTFIAGVYGMNFENMPELHWNFGYFIIWGIMIIVAVVMINYFKRKKWL